MEGIVRGIIKLNPLTEIIFLISVSIISFANNSLKLDFFRNIIEKAKKISASISNKVENFVDLLENKICYPERNEFKDRCDFSNLRNEFEKFVKIVYQILVYLTLFSIVSIFIPLILILIYQFSMYFFTLLTTIWKVIIALIYHT